MTIKILRDLRVRPASRIMSSCTNKTRIVFAKRIRIFPLLLLALVMMAGLCGVVGAKSGVVIGDSIAAGYAAGDGSRLWPTVNLYQFSSGGSFSGEMQMNYTRFWWYNQGIGGQITATIWTRWPRDALGYTYYVPDGIPNTTLWQKPDYLIVEAGVNDIHASVPASNTEYYLYKMAVNATENNIPVIFVTVPPVGGYVSYSDIAVINSWMLTNLTNVSPNVRVYNCVPLLDNGSHYLKPAYDPGDGVHPSSAAYVDMSAQIFQQNYDLLHSMSADTYLPFNETSGSTTFIDYSGNNHIISKYGSPNTTSITSVFGGSSVYFPSVYPTFGNSSIFWNKSTINGPFSLSMWVNTLGNRYQWLWGSNYGLDTGYFELSGNQSRIFYNTSYIDKDAATIKNNAWTYLIVTRNSTNGWTLGVNGTSYSLVTNSSILPFGDIILGWSKYLGNNYWYNGYMDDVVFVDGYAANTSVVPSREHLSNPSVSFTYITSPLTASFSDATVDKASIWLWDFGDGNVSTSQNPVHAYPAAGNYSVSLVAVNPFGSGKYQTNITITALLAQFTPSGPLSITYPNGIYFQDASTGSPTAWYWDWGDGTSCDTQNCYKQWYGPGTYTVRLNASTATAYSVNYTIVNVRRLR